MSDKQPQHEPDEFAESDGQRFMGKPSEWWAAEVSTLGIWGLVALAADDVGLLTGLLGAGAIAVGVDRFIEYVFKKV